MENRFCSVRPQVRAEGDEAGKSVTGYASVFYDGTKDTEYVMFDDAWGVDVERIMPGAFNSMFSRGDDVRALFNHDSNNVLGRASAGTLRLSVDARGLRYEANLPETSVASDVLVLLKRGEVTGSSFSFWLKREGIEFEITTDQDGRQRTIWKIIDFARVYDVGPVTFPAYEATTAESRSGVKEPTDSARLRSELRAIASRDADKLRLANALVLFGK